MQYPLTISFLLSLLLVTPATAQVSAPVAVVCSPDLDTDDDGVPDESGLLGEFSVTFEAAEAYDSVEVRSDGVPLLVAAGPFATGESVYLDNAGEPVAFALLGAWELVAIVGGDESESVTCDLGWSSCGSLTPPADIECEPLNPSVEWTNADDYDAVHVLADGVAIARGSGTYDQWWPFSPSILPGGGEYEMQVVGVRESDGCLAISETCLLWIAGDEVCAQPDLLVASIFDQATTLDWDSPLLLLADPEGDRVDIVEVQIELDITTPRVGDLNVEVTSPEGTLVTLMDGHGGDAVDLQLRFTDNGAPIDTLDGTNNDAEPPARFTPAAGSDADWFGEDAQGEWVLTVGTDWALSTVNEWCIEVFADEPFVLHYPIFIRGDVDGNGIFNALLDALRALDFVFGGAAPPPCTRAADADGNDEFHVLLDSLFILDAAFSGGAFPPSPFPDCGIGENAIESKLNCSVQTVCN